MTVTLTTLHEKLRRSTALMLGLDYARLTAAQSVRLDRAAMLRLELDDCQTKKLAGQPFDTNKYVAASESLERLFGSDPETPVTDDFSGARDELNNFFVQRAERIEAREARESERLREQVAVLREEITQLRAQLKASEPVPRPNNVIQIDGAERANATKPPANYLRDGQPREAWRDGPSFTVPSWPLPR